MHGNVSIPIGNYEYTIIKYNLMLDKVIYKISILTAVIELYIGNCVYECL